MVKLEKLCNDSLAPICTVILVTGAGGMFGGVSRLFGLDEKTTLKTWTVMETLLGTIAFLIVLTFSSIL